MCYYATTDYRCGDWRWGNMKLRCPRQHRMGETCGAKLVHHESVTKSDEDCKTCQEITIKRRRLNKETENIVRWSKEGAKFAASIEKAQREAQLLQRTIDDLENKRPTVMMKRQGPHPQAGPDLGFSHGRHAERPGVSASPAVAAAATYGGAAGTSYPNSQGQFGRHDTPSAASVNSNDSYYSYGSTSSSTGNLASRHSTYSYSNRR